MEKGTYAYRVEAGDVDFTLKASLVSLCDYILRAAGDDADGNSFGVRDLNLDGCSWVLLRMGVEVYRRMEELEHFTVRTWVNDVNRMMTTRNMIVRDASGEVVASAVTQWAVIDTHKRRAVDITAHVHYLGAVVNEPSPISAPLRIPAVEAQTTQLHTVVYSDIDFNRHVGSVKYIGWMCDMLPADIIMHREVARLDINYIHEARFGQVLRLGMANFVSGGKSGEISPDITEATPDCPYTVPISNERSLFEVSSVEGQTSCRAVISWKNESAVR